MDRHELPERDDVLLFESPSGLARLVELAQICPPVEAARVPALTLYVVSLFGVHNQRGERVDGDALLVRAPNEPDHALLAAVLGCTEPDLNALLDRGGAWSTRQITSIDGYRLRFEPS